PALSAFLRERAGLRIHLFTAADSETIVDEGYDVIVAGRKPPLPGLTDSDLGPVKHVVCAAPQDFKGCGRPRKPQDLVDHTCLTNLSAPKGWPFQNGGRPFQVEVKGAFSANSSAVLIAMAVQDFGIVRVPHDAVRARLADKTLQAIFT